MQQSWSLANSQHIVSACPSKYYPQHWQQPLYPFSNLSIFSIYLEDFQEPWKKKLKCPGRKPSIARRNSLFKCKTKISGLFSMPMRLHREQCSQWTVDRKKGKSFLGIKRHCVVERHGASKPLSWCTCTHTQKHAYSILRYWESPKTYVGSVQSIRPMLVVK